MSAASDLVNKNILLRNIKVYKAYQSTVNWIYSYLSDRSQQVYIDGVLTDKMSVTLGVPLHSKARF